MAIIVTRETGATAVNRTLTNAELDNNFINLNTDLESKQPLDADLTAIAALSETSGLLRKTAANTWVLDTGSYSSTITFADVTTALGFTPENSSNKGQANGYASLDSSGLVPSSQLPSYVDDVLEYANLAAFPATGSSGKIYLAQDTSKIYRWSGSTYIEITGSPGSTDSVAEGSTNLYFTDARSRSAISVTQNLSYNSTTGLITGPDLSGYLTSASASSTYQTQSGMSSYLTTTDAATTYQTQSGMSSYLTVSTAASTYQLVDPDLTAIAALAGSSGILKKTAADTWTLDTSAYLTSISSTDITTALGFTPYDNSNPSSYITVAEARSALSATQNISYNSTTGVLTGPDLSSYLSSSSASSTYQPLDDDLTAIAALAGTSGVLKKTATNTWELDTTITGGGGGGGITTGKAIAMAMIFGG